MNNKINELEYINELSCNEITKLSNEFKNSIERKQLKLKINKTIIRKIIGQNRKIYKFVIYEYYRFVNNKKQYFRYYPEKYKYLFRKQYDTKLIFDNFNNYCGLIRNRFTQVSWVLCKYYAKKLNLFENMSFKDSFNKTYATKIYIHIDDCYGKSRENSKIYKTNAKIIKIFSDTNKKPLFIYETYTSKDPKKLSNDSRASLLLKIIEKHYYTDKNTQIYLLSDGAKYFKNLAKLLNAKHIYDYYHFKKRFGELFKKPFFIFDSKMRKQKLYINNLSAKDWILQAINDKNELVNRLNYLSIFYFANKESKNNIKSFINFVLRNCKEYQFYIDNITCEAESSVSLFKSFFAKRYSIYSMKTILELIKLNNSHNYELIDINDFADGEDLTYEPLMMSNNYKFTAS
ncbi:Mbov_0401 family ICE element transposase-like protein [Mycoplasma sp. HS2188]|uniref:Mbov_0401 family ICE element transposase-like protein n=1 Tax=Mycoplasma sp. HS2188 TaxID=2976765 RepID=UPI0021AAE87B|nr:hypothetical protein [Mycoplasma sp. HS2188]MCT4469960.1 hypothetical protein [Mycoplasma sp. HS2188]